MCRIIGATCVWLVAFSTRSFRITKHAPDPVELYQLRVGRRCTTEEDPAKSYHPIVARMYYIYNLIARTAVNILDQLQMGHSPGYKAMMTESYMDRRLIGP
jgi:hypothetical protein